jgi:hypothetical protein
MQRGIIAPQVPLGQDCAVIEEQLLPGAARAGSADAPPRTLPGDRKRAEALQAVIDSVVPPVMDDGGIFGGDMDEFSPVPGSSTPDAGGAGGYAENAQTQGSQAEMYWADSQEPDDGTSSSASMRVDEQQQLQHGCDEAGRDEGIGDSDKACGGCGTALEKRLSVEQYLYVVAALCQVSCCVLIRSLACLLPRVVCHGRISELTGCCATTGNERPRAAQAPDQGTRVLPTEAHGKCCVHRQSSMEGFVWLEACLWMLTCTLQVSLMEFIAAMHATIVVEKITGEDLS